MNAAGIVIGETTVAQTPFEPDGHAAEQPHPQGGAVRLVDRRRRRASSREQNNGMYTNDWPIADVKTDEVAIFLLGTDADRSCGGRPTSRRRSAPPGFLWANNNARDPGVRARVRRQPDDAPYDLGLRAVEPRRRVQRSSTGAQGEDRRRSRGVRLWASSPINRPHACDGKITDLRDGRAARLPGPLRQGHAAREVPRRREPPHARPARARSRTSRSATPPSARSSSPSKLKAARAAAPRPRSRRPRRPTLDLEAVDDRYAVDARRRSGTGRSSRRPTRDDWLVSGGAAYWQILHDLPEKAAEGRDGARRPARRAELRGCSPRLAREADVAAPRRAASPTTASRPTGSRASRGPSRSTSSGCCSATRRSFAFMNERSTSATAGRPVDDRGVPRRGPRGAGRDVAPFLRRGSSAPASPTRAPTVDVARRAKRRLARHRRGRRSRRRPTTSSATVAIDAGGKRGSSPLDVDGASSASRRSTVAAAAASGSSSTPATTSRSRTSASTPAASFADDFTRHAHRPRHGAPDRGEPHAGAALPDDARRRLHRDAAAGRQGRRGDEAQLAARDLIVLGGPARQRARWRASLPALPVELGTSFFRFEGGRYAAPDDGLFLVLPSPFDPTRVLYLFAANCAARAPRDDEDLPRRPAGVGGLQGREGREGRALPAGTIPTPR